MSRDWQQEFDFQDQPKKNSKKNINKKISNVANNDFDQLQDQDKNVKFPSINNKNNNKNIQPTQKKNQNVSLQQIAKNKLQTVISKKKEQQAQYEEQFQQPVVESPKIKNQTEIKNNKSMPIVDKEQQVNQYEEEFEQLEEQKQQIKNQKNKKQSSSPILYKAKNQGNQKSQNKLKLPKPVDKVTNKTQISKQKNESNNRQPSRNSGRSQSQSRTIEVKYRGQQKKEQTLTNKYSQLAQKTCPDHDKKYLQDLQMDKLVRQNDKVRGLIKKLNDQLNDLINKNIMQMKSKKEDKVTIVQDILKVLQEQKSNNQANHQITIRQLQRLKSKQGQLRQQQFQQQIQAKISETKISIAQYSKILTKIRNQINNQGIKLLKIDKDNTTLQDVNNIKNNLMNAKKDQQRNEENIKKLDIKYEQLNDKINGMENKIKSLVQDASSKGYSIANNPQNKKKVEELKRKIEIGKQHKLKTQALFKTKSEMIIHQSDQIRNQIKLNDKIIQIAVNNCEQAHVQVKNIVDKAKKNGKLTNQFIVTLQSIINQMENSTKSQSRQQKDSNMNYPKGSKKYQSVKNVQKVLINTNSTQQKEQISLKKPNLFKKKEKDQEQEGSKQRIWKDQKEKQIQKKKNEQFTKFEDKESQKKDEERKKPFVIKKNRQSKSGEGQISSPNQIKKQQNYQLPLQIKKDDTQTPSIAPRMMKFKKNKPQDQQITKTIPQNVEKKIITPVIQQKTQNKTIQEQDKINFAPKRFNLKLKDKKNEQSGYTASVIAKKQEQKIVQKPIQEFKPKGLNFQKQPLFNIQPKKQNNSILNNPVIQAEEEEKPKINLRLRDRQKQSNKLIQPNLQIPSQGISKSPESNDNKVVNNISDNLKSQNNVSKQNNPYINPYANNGNPIKKQREGPIKKQKPAQSIEKKNFNIYQQAQDIGNVNEIKINREEPKFLNKPISNEEPDLNKLLGIEKKNIRNELNQDLLVDNKNIGKKQKKVESKKDTNFFGDLQL